MKTFVIQTENRNIIHDFSFHLIEAIKYNNWYSGEKIYDYSLTDKINILEDRIPIGSVEFILETLSKIHNIKEVKPINIPIQLNKENYLKRYVNTISNNIPIDIASIDISSAFIKDNYKIKGLSKVVKKGEVIPIGEWLVSEVIDIKSEWRAFVFNNELVGLQNYAGNFTMFPDVELIKKMIKDYQGQNPAYTLDVGINVVNGTFLIEIHDFFSCGLYGFNDYIALPRMFIATWNKLIRKEVFV